MTLGSRCAAVRGAEPECPPVSPFHPPAILVWEEVWDLPDSAALSSWLLLLITAGAMVGSWFFERRIWCRSGPGAAAGLALCCGVESWSDQHGHCPDLLWAMAGLGAAMRAGTCAPSAA